MSNVGQVAGGVVGGVAGFFLGGPVGAVQGFALGFSIASALFPADLNEGTKSQDPFEVTTATEGTPVPLIFGRRRVSGNVIFFDYSRLKIKEVTPDGKGKGLGKATDSEYGTFAYAPVAIGVAMGTMETLHGIYNQKDEDWDKINSDNDGHAIQISTKGAEIDFGYGPIEPISGEPKSSPITGGTVLYSSKLFLGQNTRNMTPLEIDGTWAVSPESSAFCGSSKAGMPDGCVNPANVYYDLLTETQAALGLPESALNQISFQEARQIYENEGLGIAPKWETQKTAKEMFKELHFHTESIFRRATDGTIELFPIRDRSADWSIPQSACSEENMSGRSWKNVYNVFFATFPELNSDVPFTQRTVKAKNDAAIALSGRRNEKTYNFPHFTDRQVAANRLEAQKRKDSYPLCLLSVSVPKEYHALRVGDVCAITHSKFNLLNFDMRIVERVEDDFGGTGIRLRLLQELSTIDGNVGPTVVQPPEPGKPITEPYEVLGLGVTQENWRSRMSGPPWIPPYFPPTTGTPGTPRNPGNGGPISGDDDETGFFGYPMLISSAPGSNSDLGIAVAVRENLFSELPANEAPSGLVMGRGHLFTLDEDLGAGDFSCALDDNGIILTKEAFSADDEFDLPDQDGEDSDGVMVLETSPYLMLIGNYEYARWGRVVDLGGGSYRFELVMRCANKVRPLLWPAGTKVMIYKVRRPVIPDGLNNYLAWPNRPRFISTKEHDDNIRLRIYAQSVSYAQRIQPVADQLVETLEAPVHPLEVLSCNRAPTPAVQGIVFGNQDDEDRAWYPLVGGSTGDMEIQIQPFPNDWDGIGDRIVAPSALVEPFGPEPYLPTDLHSYDDYLTDVDGGRAYGLTYRLRVWENETARQAGDSPIITQTATTTFEGTWPSFSLTEISLEGLGGNMTDSPMMVDVLTESGYYNIPCPVAKIGVWDASGISQFGGGLIAPVDLFPRTTE